jgi:hypothetical protein
MNRKAMIKVIFEGLEITGASGYDNFKSPE